MQDKDQPQFKDDVPLSPEEEALVDARLAGLRENPQTALSLEEMKARLRARYPN